MNAGDFLNMSERKKLLFACACFRNVWDTLEREAQRKVILAELRADGRLPEKQRFEALADNRFGLSGKHTFGPFYLMDVPFSVGAAVFNRDWPNADAVWQSAFYEVVGPELTIDVPERVKIMAEEAYNHRDFSFLGAIADALEDSGCEADLLLSHLRSTPPCHNECYELYGARWVDGLTKCRCSSASHRLGCWAVDLLRGATT